MSGITGERIAEIQEYCDDDTLDLLYREEVEYLVGCYAALANIAKAADDRKGDWVSADWVSYVASVALHRPVRTP